MRLRPYSIFLLLLLIAPCAHAQNATLELNGLPTYSEVYLNGEPLPRPDRKPTAQWQIPAGEHELQIEAWVDNRVAALRCKVQVEIGQKQSVQVELKPVFLTSNAMMGARGRPGLRGAQGPPGRAAGTATSFEGGVVFSTVRESIGILLADLFGAVTQIDMELSAPLPKVTWYFYRRANSHGWFPPQGPQGAVGPQGTAGFPGDVKLLQVNDTRPLLPGILGSLGLIEVETDINELQSRVAAVNQSRLTLAELNSSISINLFTPRWKDWYDMRHGLLERGKHTAHCCTWGPTGLPGAQGPRGKDGEVPDDAPRIRLSDEQVQALLEKLRADTNLQNSIRQLNARVRELNNRIVQSTASPQTP